MRAGLAIAPGPFLVPVTSLLVAGRLIQRFGAAPSSCCGFASFVARLRVVGVSVGLDAEPAARWPASSLTGIGVGLTLPTLMGAAARRCRPLLRDRLGRGQHDPPGRHGDGRRDICRCRGIAGVAGGAGPRPTSRMVDHGRRLPRWGWPQRFSLSARPARAPKRIHDDLYAGDRLDHDGAGPNRATGIREVGGPGGRQARVKSALPPRWVSFGRDRRVENWCQRAHFPSAVARRRRHATPLALAGQPRGVPGSADKSSI